MEDSTKPKTFDHARASVSDQFALVAELEHIRRHALRSAVVAQGTEQEMFYLITATQARDLRRAYMEKHFPNIDSKLWCLCKSAATLRQLAYEVWSEGAEQLKEIDNLVDSILGGATGKDLSECEACLADKGEAISDDGKA